MYQTETIKLAIDRVIRDNIDNPDLNGEFIAEQLGVNRMYIHRKLKQFYNLNARDYIQLTRINRVKRELKKSNKPINIIAEKVGYDDSSYFTKVFKKIVGMTPSAFRRYSLCEKQKA